MRFTIRDLLWLTVVMALGVAWWVDRGKMAVRSAERDRAWRELVNESLGEIATKTGQDVWIETPDGELFGWSPSRSFPSHESQAATHNPPKK